LTPPTAPVFEPPQPAATPAVSSSDNGWAHRWLIFETGGWIIVGLAILLWLQPATNIVEVPDSVAHVLLFLGTAATSTALFLRRRPWFLLASLVLLAVFGIFTELTQAVLTKDRVGEFGDVQADILGIIMGALIAIGLGLVIGKARTQQLMAIGSALALLTMGTTMVATSATVQRWWQCRDMPELATTPQIAGLEPLIFQANPWSVQLPAEAPAPTSQPQVGSAWCRVMANGQFTVTAWVRTSTNDQWGPSRIVSSSVGTETPDVNFHLGQEFDAASIRIRTGGDIRVDWELVDNVFVADTWQHLSVTFDGGDTRLFVDGAEVAQFNTIHGWIAGWDRQFPLLIGDEASRDRTFLGDIEGVAIFDQALDSETLLTVMTETRQS